MADEAILLEAILADPDNDTVRLVYADWLEERGDPKGEFIRLQCAHAKKWHEAIFITGDVESERMEQLDRDHREEWLQNVPQLKGVEWSFWRGLPGWIQMANWQVFRRHADAIFQAAPVEYVTFTSLSLVGARSLAQSPYLKRIRVLDLGYGAIQQIGALQALLRSDSLELLQTLRLFHGSIGNDVAFALANCPHLRNLKLLTLYSSYIDDAGALAIAHSPHLAQVEFIDLSRNQISEEAEESLRKVFGDRVNV